MQPGAPHQTLDNFRRTSWNKLKMLLTWGLLQLKMVSTAPPFQSQIHFPWRTAIEVHSESAKPSQVQVGLAQGMPSGVVRTVTGVSSLPCPV